VVTKEMLNFSAITCYFEEEKLHYFSFYSKSEKAVKGPTCHLPIDTPAKDIYNRLVLSVGIVNVQGVREWGKAGNTAVHMPGCTSKFLTNIACYSSLCASVLADYCLC
jgi:hypothetical protein